MYTLEFVICEKTGILTILINHYALFRPHRTSRHVRFTHSVDSHEFCQLVSKPQELMLLKPSKSVHNYVTSCLLISKNVPTRQETILPGHYVLFVLKVVMSWTDGKINLQIACVRSMESSNYTKECSCILSMIPTWFQVLF